MAKKRRAPYRPTPPSPIRRGKAARERIAEIERQRAEENAARRRNLERANQRKREIGGNAFEVTLDLLRENTRAEWAGERERPVAFWDESWIYTVTDGEVAYDELVDWHFAWVSNAVVARYFEGRVSSIILDVADGTTGAPMVFTAAAAADFGIAAAELLEKLDRWARDYGRDSGGDFSTVSAITILIRRDSVHKRWRSVVRGRAEKREADAIEAKNAAYEAKRRRRKKR